MIRIRVTATDKVVPRYLADVLSENIMNITQGSDIAITSDMIKGIKMTRENSKDVCTLADMAQIIDMNDDKQVSLQRADITIDDQNQVKCFD